MDFNKIFESIPEAIVVLSPKYKILAATDTYLRITMRKRDQITGLHFLLEAFPDRELSYEDNPVRASLDKVLETKETDFLDVMRYDLVNTKGDYDVRYWEAYHTPVLDESGSVSYIIQNTFDVTEREQAKHALNKSEEKLNFIAESMPQLIFTTDKDGKLNYFNKRWQDFTGIPLKELLQDKWESVIHPEDMPILKAKLEHALNTGTDMQIELRKRDKNGHYRWHLWCSIPMKNAKGEITMWVGSATDIHDTRKMVQELLETNEQMSLLSDQVQLAFENAEAERKTLETLIMEAPAMFIMLEGPKHKIKLINDKYQQLYPGRELIGMALAEAHPEHEQHGFVALLDNVYKTGEVYVAEGVPAMFPKDGVGPLEERFFNFSYQPIYDSGKVSGILAFGYEITNEVLYRKEMNKLEQH